MADFKIKSTAGTGNKTLIQSQDQSGSSYAIQVGDAGATTLTNATITAGTLGSAVAFNDAHKDIDIDADGWMRYANANAEATSSAVIVWDGVGKMGSNITYDGTSDYIQVAKAGWYFISVHYVHLTKEDQNVELFVRQSQSTGATPSGNSSLPRLLGATSNDGITYWGKSITGYLYLSATDRVDVYGIYHLYGSPNLYDAMTLFTGVRLGA
tara:strand:- start:375 stop:1007 length:633 start_codon:yes stop_codon:yes gene_type:complete